VHRLLKVGLAISVFIIARAQGLISRRLRTGCVSRAVSIVSMPC
jgi:hypothetical protein